jgi:hypothetical protein
MSLKLKVTTSLNHSTTGTLHTLSKCIISLKVNNNRKITFRIFNLDFVRTIQVVGPGNKVIRLEDVERDELGRILRGIKGPEGTKTTSRGHTPPSSTASRGHTPSSSTASAHLPTSSPDPDSITARLTRKLTATYGPANVTRPGSDIVIFDEIKLSKPYTLGKSGNIQVLKDSNRLEEVKDIVKEFWLEVGSGRKGG